MVPGELFRAMKHRDPSIQRIGLLPFHIGLVTRIGFVDLAVGLIVIRRQGIAPNSWRSGQWVRVPVIAFGTGKKDEHRGTG